MADWPRWEVFLRPNGGLARQHVGSVHAPDAELAVQLARDLYTRRNEGISLWVAQAAHVVAGGTVAPATEAPATPVAGTQLSATPVAGTQLPGTPVGGTQLPGTPVGGTQLPGTSVGGTETGDGSAAGRP